MKRVVALVLILIAATGLFATSLWNGTRVGMSMDEIEELFFDMKPMRYEHEDRATLSIWPFEDEHDVIKSVSFQFFKNRLIAVGIEMSEWEFIRSHIMIAKYGPYIDHFTHVDIYSGIQETWTWINGKTLITFHADSLGDEGYLSYIDIDSIGVLLPGADLF